MIRSTPVLYEEIEPSFFAPELIEEISFSLEDLRNAPRTYAPPKPAPTPRRATASPRGSASLVLLTTHKEKHLANLSGFDASKQGEMLNFDAFPAHKALGMMTKSEMKPTKAGTGSYLECEFTLLNGQFKGRKVWSRLNLSNPNKQAEDIAQRELGAICKAVGIITPLDSSELHNKPIMLDIAYEPASKDNKAQNYIKGYTPATGTAGAAAPALTSAQQMLPQSPAPAAIPPWKR
jgi:hypothetical protein